MFKSQIFLFIFYFLPFLVVGQKIDSTDKNYKAYFNEAGNKISEGYLVDGKPNGYWINYYANGLRKSEGNRKNFLLDSVWKFYSEKGNLKTLITYEKGKLNGVKKYFNNCFLVKKEQYDSGKIVGEVVTYYADSSEQIKRTVPYKNNLKDGIAFHYAKDRRLIELVTYNKGFVKDREKINRFNEQGKKEGLWKEYYGNDRLKKEKRYKNGLLNGYVKNYNKEGKLESAYLYIDGERQAESENEANFNIENEYYDNGNLKKKTIYNMNGKKDGIEKKYNPSGELVSAALYKNGHLMGEGLVDEKGWYQGEWKHYYLNRNKKSEGRYKDGKKVGEWMYYFRNGNKEQTGTYNSKGEFTGLWKWYFENGDLLRKEEYRNGERDGYLEEYAADGQLITKGEYVDGLKEGPWVYELNDHREEGNYSYGERDGEWKFYHKNGKLSFVGSFVEGLPDGKHKYYNTDGTLIKEEKYEFGQKVGHWKWYDQNGVESLKIQYKNGELWRVNGNKVKF